MTEKKSNGNSIWIALSRNFLQFLALIGVVAAIWHATSIKFESLRERNEVMSTTGFVTAAEVTKQLDCLARNIYHEAGVENFEGKVAVAQVTMNRLDSGRFGKDLCTVVYQRNVVYEKVICQFSWACMPSVYNKPLHPAQFKESQEVAKKVLLEDFRLPGLKEALFYHADYVDPRWGLPKVAKIGRHIFYKDKERA